MKKSNRPHPIIDIGPVDDEIPRQKKAEFNKLRLLAALAPLAWCYIAILFGIADDMGGPKPIAPWLKAVLLITGVATLFIFGQALGHAWRWRLVFFWIWPMVLFGILMLLVRVPITW
jgi:hypothetical protein